MPSPTTAAPTSPAAGHRARAPHWAVVLVVDVVLVLLFAALGRNAHALDATGLLSTAWPFLVGLAVGWAVWRVRLAPAQVWPRGVGLWLTTVGVGMLLRVLTGDGTAASFVLVTLAVLGGFLLVPRLLTRFQAVRRSAGTARSDATRPAGQ